MPAHNIQAKGHTQGKKSNIPGKLAKALGVNGWKNPAVRIQSEVSRCTVLRGQRRTPNPQQGRPANTATIQRPDIAGDIFVEFEFNVLFPTSSFRLTIGFRQGKRYTWNGVSIGDASGFFPGMNFGVPNTLTDQQDIHNALEFFNRVAKRTFLSRAADSTSMAAPVSKLVWNPSLTTTTTTTLTVDNLFNWTTTVTAANGVAPLGVLTLNVGKNVLYTLLSSDGGVHTFSPTPTGLTLPVTPSISFAGASGFGDSSFADSNFGGGASFGTGVPGARTCILHYGRTVMWPTASWFLVLDGTTLLTVTTSQSGSTPNWSVLFSATYISANCNAVMFGIPLIGVIGFPN